MTDEPQLDELLLLWEASRDAGTPLDVTELCRDNPDLESSVRERIAAIEAMDQLLAENTGATSADDTPAASIESTKPDPAHPRRLVAHTPYVVQDLHRRGGRGDVFRARDETFHREVAVKTMRGPRPRGTAPQHEFYHEARVTSRLDHPGVVPVYGMGEDDQRQPFYVMRFVQGETLWDALQRVHAADKSQPSSRRRREVQLLVDRFLSVCNTVAYAHDRGWLHRDIKPQNILLGDFGETLVADWGLAKPADAPEQAVRDESLETAPQDTHAGTIKGTPAYMSPEQAAGDPAAIGVASDIYSLGATLYAVLTGRPPVVADAIGETMRRVQAGDFPVPRELNREVPRPLEAICLKALATDRAERYDSALELIQDIQQWRADEPVGCYRERATERLARWGRRHRTWVTSATVLLCTAVVALSVGVTLLDRERAKVEAARADAEENFQYARQAVNQYYVTVSESQLLNQPGLRPLREQLLRQALDYYRRFLASHGDDAELRDMVAETHRNIGRIVSEIGSQTDALKSFERSRDFRREMLDRRPSDTEAQFQYAVSLDSVASSLRQLSRLRESQDCYLESIRIKQQAVRKSPNNPRYQQSLAIGYNNVASLLDQQGLHAEAIARYGEARDLQQTLSRHTPDDPLLRRELALTHDNLGLALWMKGRLDESLDSHKRAVDLFRQLRTSRPDDQRARHDLSRALRNIARRLTELGRFPDASPFREQAETLLAELVRENPLMMAYRNDLAGIVIEHGARLMREGRLEDALPRFVQAVEHYAELRRVDQASTAFTFNLAAARLNAAYVSSTLKRHDDALNFQRQAIQLVEPLHARSPDEPQIVGLLSAAFDGLGTIYKNQGRPAEALPWYRKAGELRDEQRQKSPQHPHYQVNAGQSRLNQGLVLIELDRWAESEQALATAAERFEAAVKQVPANDQWREWLGQSVQNLVEVDLHFKRHQSTVTRCSRLRELWSGKPNHLAQVALYLARAAELVDADKELDPADREPTRRRYLTAALDTLRRAVAAGWSGWTDWENEPAAKSLRAEPDYQKLRQSRRKPNA